jgi:competence protein ComEC
MRDKRNTAWQTKATCVLVALAIAATALAACEPTPKPLPEPSPTQGTVSVYVWDVGEALSVLIDDDDAEILIDAGNDWDGAAIAEKVKPYVTDGTIEYVIATHSHADHIGGMEDIYGAYHVAHTIYGDLGTSKQYKEFMDAANAEAESVVKEDEDEAIGMPNGAVFTILDILDGASNTNNNSVIAVLESGGYKMLVTGDTEDDANKGLVAALTERLQTERLYPVDIYIVGHHGSETSSSDGLLSLIKPKYAIISSEGTQGQYDNPDKSVIARLSDTGATIFATYRSGDIRITLGKNGIALSAPDREQITLNNYRDAA